jgi:glycosyltransferase involved in cell wall biosynthesis
MLLSVVVPVYNSQNTLKSLIRHLYEALQDIDYEVVLVNDGSIDASEQVCKELSMTHAEVKFVSLRRNFGEFHAVICGLNHAQGDYVVIIDDDFQNPPTEILKLVKTAQNANYDVVYSYYTDKQHHWFRNLGSNIVNYLTTWLLDKPKNLYLSSFKLISQPVVKEIIKYKGPYPYIDGLILRVTRNIGTVEVTHHERPDGQSGYTFRKLISLFLTIIFGYSLKPLRLLLMLGFVLFITGIFLLFFIPFMNNLLLIVGGLVIMSLGIIGEYIGRMYMTMSGLPQYIER